MEIEWEEIQAVLPQLSVTAHQEIKILVLERRLQAATDRNTMLQHQVDMLEEAVKQPQLIPIGNGVQVA